MSDHSADNTPDSTKREPQTSSPSNIQERIVQSTSDELPTDPLSRDEQRTLEHLFVEANERGLEYVVARKYEQLPEAVSKDVDVQVRASQFDEYVRLCERIGFEHRSPSNVSHLSIIAARAIKDPVKAVNEVLSSPKGVLRLLRGGHSHKQNYRNIRFKKDNLKLDVRNHLAYKSPSYDIRIRVDPAIEEQLLNRRRPFGQFYVPAPVDELAHIVSHCVFDKDGKFSSYYTKRCNVLWREVKSDSTSRDEFEHLLSLLFFDAADLVQELIDQGRYNSIRSELLRYDDY